MARFRSKPFDPKPFTPGARIEWEHTTSDRRVILRTGIVWSGAPGMRDGGRAVWVTPDEQLVGDLHYALYVHVPQQRTDPRLVHQNTPTSEDIVLHDKPWADTCGRRTWGAAEAARSVRATNAALAS